MKKTMMFCGALALLLWLPRVGLANCGHCEKDKASAKAHCSCPCKMAGAETVVTNTDAGVTITITAKDPAVVKQIQESAAKMKAGGCTRCSGKAGCKCGKCKGENKGDCPKGCKCPKCGKDAKPAEKK